MIKGLVILAISAAVALLSHRRKSLDEKLLKQIPLSDWLIVGFFPIFYYLAWVFIVKGIVERPFVRITRLSDFDIIAITIPFIAYGSVGNSIHFTGKALWKHIHKKKQIIETAHKINEMFHGKMGHYLIFISGLIIIFLIPVLEINHPAPEQFSNKYFLAIILIGAIFGYTLKRMFWYTNEWFGGYHRPIFVFIFILLAIMGIAYIYYDLSISKYPIWIFIISVYATIELSFIFNKFAYLLGFKKEKTTLYLLLEKVPIVNKLLK